MQDAQSVQDAPTVVISEKLAPLLCKANSLPSTPPKDPSMFNTGYVERPSDRNKEGGFGGEEKGRGYWQCKPTDKIH